MSKKRHAASFDQRAVSGAAVTTLSYLYTAKHAVPRHFHEFAQVLYAVSGAMTVSAAGAIWVIPPERAVWIPPSVEHSIRMHNAVLMKSIYIRPSLTVRMPRACAVLNVSPLLRELLIQSCASPSVSLRRKREANYIALLLDELQAAIHLPLDLILPKDERALRVANYLIEQPSHGKSLSQVVHIAGAAKRTLERISCARPGSPSDDGVSN